MQLNPQTLYVISLFLWLLFFVAGKIQFNRIREHTMQLALDKAEALLRKERDLTVERCYEQLLPEWQQMVRRTAWFIPHKTELWPMLATPAYVRTRMNFTPVWLGAFLRLHGFNLPAAPDLRAQINQVLASSSGRAGDRPDR